MKKASILALAVLCFTFLGFLGGFYLGRSLSDSPVQVSRLPEPTPAQDATQDETSAEPTTADTKPGGLININTATLEELDTLPGIGPVLAQRILDYIQENGPFETMSQLTMVSGIGIERLNDIMDYATVGG